MLDAFVAVGGNFLDTANAYGESEEVIGNWLANKGTEFRESLIIATKGYNPRDLGAPSVNFGNSRKNLKASIDASLKALQTSYVDLYQVHMWDNATPLRETMSVLNELVQSGKVRYIGFSNFCGWQVQKSIDIAEKYGWEPFVSGQQQYSLLCRDIEWDSAKVAVDNGMAILPWSPLAGGWLSGKYHKDMKAPESDSRVGWAEDIGWSATSWSRYANDSTWKLLDEINTVAKEVGSTTSQVSIRWLMQKPNSIPIIGASKLSHLNDNLGAAKFSLSEAQMMKLDAGSARPAPYPFGLIQARARA